MTFRGSSKLISHNSTSCVDLDGFFGVSVKGSARGQPGSSGESFWKKLLQNDQRREYFRFDGGSVFFTNDPRHRFRRVQ